MAVLHGGVREADPPDEERDFSSSQSFVAGRQNIISVGSLWGLSISPSFRLSMRPVSTVCPGRTAVGRPGVCTLSQCQPAICAQCWLR
ncbi:hypothetical protein EYF80_016791 [Liparis tanakae]|uniref:Uncharacterized protein n=1 Tax=Liparis tanakae TaxID=230148 RepID=A0A4Z2I5F3_9TELE|nr:hypothetical protein EYF80_016791 [Liparis tanakae]